MAHVIGIDIGGTFTDCVLMDDTGRMVVDKAFTTPEDLTDGILEALGNAAGQLGLSAEAALGLARVVAVGTTSVLNRLVARKGAPVGLLTTRGHEDAILIGRVAQKTDGLSETDQADIVRWDKPAPLVPRRLIVGLTERVDWSGAELVPLNEAEVGAAAERFRSAGIQAVAVSLLWSFLRPDHEQRVRQLLAEAFPDAFVSLSSEVAPVLGEYERTATTVLNAYLGPGARGDFQRLAGRLEEAGFRGALLCMQSTGGVLRASEAAERAVHLLGSGPVGGIAGTVALGERLELPNLIATDMGGTSFDVGLVVNGRPQLAQRPVYDRLRTVVPAVEVVSVGAGGGSVAHLDRDTGTLHVGPQSAGSHPGPVCYGWGGTEPTVTDADLVLGRLNANNFFGGRKRLEVEAARAAIQERVAAPLGLSVERAAKGIVDIVDAHMADLIRRLTIERGHDPRDFVLLVYGGGGPGHVGAFARELGVEQALIPPTASVFSAFGIATSDLTREYVRSEPQRLPAGPERVSGVFAELEEAARGDLGRDELTVARLDRFIDMQFRYQAHQIRVPAPAGRLSAEDMERLEQRFLEMYEQTFGQGSAYRAAGVELITFRVVATVPQPRAELSRAAPGDADATAALQGHRQVYLEQGFEAVPIYDGQRLQAGMRVTGPALVEHRAYTLLVHEGQTADVDEYLNVRLSLQPVDAGDRLAVTGEARQEGRQ